MVQPHVSGRNIFIFLPNISEVHKCNSLNGYKKSKRMIVFKFYGTKWNCRMRKKGVRGICESIW